MSGTSADGIDAVVLSVPKGLTGAGARLLAHVHRTYPARLRRRILRVALEGTVGEVCELNFMLGEEFGRAALAVIGAAGLGPRDIAGIGSHGQTVHHLPNGKPPSTLQIGEPAVIAERTGVPVVADFRVADMAAGGQGAPLVPYADWVLFTDPGRDRLVQNIGGIANVTVLVAGGKLDEVVAFDTGPGNMVLDGVVSSLSGGRKSFDRGGRWAARGRVCEGLLREVMAHPYLLRKPPKTTGREEFGEPFVRSYLGRARKRRLTEADVVATATALTAGSIAEAYHRFILPKLEKDGRGPLQVILGGGGAKNEMLVAMLRQRIGQAELLTHEAFGIPSEAKEALAFALLARQTMLGEPGNVPSATGARHPAVLGKIVMPSNRCSPWLN